jgi:small subunit ribosomal protein S5e
MAATLPPPEVKLFNRWTFEDVEVNDLSLADYIAVQSQKHATFVPHTQLGVTQ